MSFNLFSENCNKSLLSESECLEITRKSNVPGLVVYHCLEYKSENVMGFLGEYMNLRIATTVDGTVFSQHRYFVKSLPVLKGEEQSIEDIFQKECNIYKEVLSKLEKYTRIKWKPNFYLSRSNLIVLEDLLYSGQQHVPDVLELNVNHMKRIMESLAAMHAASIVHETRTAENLGEKYRPLLFETTVRQDVEWFTTGIKCLLDIAKVHPKFQSPQHQEFIINDFETMLDPVYEMVNESQRYRNVICHRDTWRNNLMFVFENEDFMNPLSCTFVDFQFCRYSPPAIDVLLSIYLNLSKAKRQLHEQECLKWYHHCLTKELAYFEIDIDDQIPWEAFLKSCEQFKLLPVLYNGLAATVIRAPKAALLEIKNSDPDMYRKFRTVDRSDVILEIMDRDEAFKNYMLEAVEELLDELLTRKSLRRANESKENIL